MGHFFDVEQLTHGVMINVVSILTKENFNRVERE